VQAIVAKSEAADGVAIVFVTGSTAGITTIEFEPGLVRDIKEAFERIAPAGAEYKHHERWGDDNGHSHIRASILGPSLSVPFQEKKLCLGAWQQIVLVDFDTQGRAREIAVQVVGS
jgi:secondary thiamine-phosphate synthase enzyme